jgi:hypothetical protein
LAAAGGDLAKAIIRGMASGLASGASSVASSALNVAKNALNSAKGFLGISSPSKAFQDVGKWASLGMADGISTYAKKVDRSAEGVGKTALKSLKASMSGLSDAVRADVDMNPTIRPVLDLTQVSREASRMGGLLATNPINAEVSYRRAKDISAESQALQQANYEAAQESVTKEISFEQNNYSPKAIGAVETYRNTKSLISLAKEAL